VPLRDAVFPALPIVNAGKFILLQKFCDKKFAITSKAKKMTVGPFSNFCQAVDQAKNREKNQNPFSNNRAKPVRK
jgi:hypothetical protein